MSTPASTRWTVTPVTRAPWASACPTASAPANAGRSDGWTLIAGATASACRSEERQVAGEDDELRPLRPEPGREARVPVVDRREGGGGKTGPVGPREPGGGLRGGADGDDPDVRRGRREAVDQRLQVRARAGDEHDDPQGVSLGRPPDHRV